MAEQLRKAGLAPTVSSEPPAVIKKAGLIKLKNGQKFELIFGYLLKHKPEHVHVETLCYGDLNTRRAGQRSTEHFAAARIDIKGLIERVCVDSIFLVEENKDFCTVRMECTVGIVKHHTGLNRYKGTAYEKIVRKALANVWASADIKRSENETSLVLRRVIDKQAVTISFAIE